MPLPETHYDAAPRTEVKTMLGMNGIEDGAWSQASA
jgi:hypothetical protein